MIKSKKDAKLFLVHFVDIASWDGEKYYLTITHDQVETTLIQYRTGECAYYQKHPYYWFLKERPITNKEIYALRKAINYWLREHSNPIVMST